MVNRAEDQCVTLGVQHRMAPAIASLITPAIYENLKNADNVKHYQEIMGCPNRVYFIDHRCFETKTVRKSTLEVMVVTIFKLFN